MDHRIAHRDNATNPATNDAAAAATAETLDDPYYKRVPLPRIAGYRKLDREAQLANMVQSPHWHDTLRRNIVLLSRNIARQTNYANTLIAQELNNLYRAQVMYA